MIGLTQNEHGIGVDKYPARFRTIDECNRFMLGELPFPEMLQPGTKEYDDSPYERGYIIGPSINERIN